MRKLMFRMNAILLALLTVILLTSCTLPWMEEEDELNITRKFKATWNVHERFEQHSDGSVTYHSVMWGGLVGLVKEHNLPVDWSGYESITFEFAEPTEVEIQVLLGRSLNWGRKGITKLTCYFDGLDMHQVDQVVLQTSQATTLNIKSVMLSKVSTSWESKSIWEGECVFDNWKNGFVIQPDQFSTAEEGDKLEFVFTTDYSDPKRSYWQIKTIYNTTDQTLEGNFSEQNDWGCAPVGREATTYRIRLTAKDVKELKKNGLFANGFYVNVTQVNLLRRGIPGGREANDDEEEKDEHVNKWE